MAALAEAAWGLAEALPGVFRGEALASAAAAEDGVVVGKYAAGLAGVGSALYGYKRLRGSSVDAQTANMLVPTGKRRRSTFNDGGGSYTQMTYQRSKSGKRIKTLTRHLRLLKTTVEPLRYRFGTAQDVNAAQGTYWLSNRNLDSINRALPVYLMPLFNVRQGGGTDQTVLNARAMYQLTRSTAGYAFRPTYGIDPVAGTGLVTAVRQVPPSITGNDGPGRKGLCDWTRFRFCFWGKKKNPSNIRVSLIKFLDEELCPETYDDKTGVFVPPASPPIGATVSDKAAEFYQMKVKYLLNGHLGIYNRFDRQKYVKVIKQWNINFNPIDAAAETADSDGRAHMRHLDIFNRWNRPVDYTDRNLKNPQSYTDTLNINLGGTPNDAFSGYLKNPERNVYIMIESVQPVADDVANAANPVAAPSDFSDLTCSFDVVMESNYSIMKY